MSDYAPVTRAALAVFDTGIVPVFLPPGRKNPLTKGWQNKRPTRQEVIEYYERNPDHGIGILEGPASNIVEFDCDGPDAGEALRELLGGEPPETFTIQGRRGMKLYFAYDSRFDGLKAKHNVGNLEIRLSPQSNLQSMVWGTTDDPDHDRDHSRSFDPADLARLAALPDHVVETIIGIVPRATEKKSEPQHNALTELESQMQMPKVLAALGALHPSRAERYDDWLRVCIALKSLGETYYPIFDSWSRQSANYGGTREMWDSVQADGRVTIGTLFWMADQDRGVEPKTDFETLPSVSLRELLDEPDEPIIPVVEGLIGLGDVTAIIAAPKKQKSWFVMQLAASIAAGERFLDREVTQGNVVIFDNELRLRDLRRRFRATATAMNLPEAALDSITLVSRKGQHTTIEAIRDDILHRVRAGETFSLCVVDALYKTFAPGTDENSTGDMIHVYSVLEEIAEKANCAVIIVHHATKGSQKGKSNTDVGSGSGVQSRSVDNHATILPLEDDPGVCVFAATVRTFAPPEPFCIRYEYPLWKVAPDFTPEGRTPPTIEEFAATIPLVDTSKKDALKASRDSLKVSVSDVDSLLAAAVERGLVILTVPEQVNRPHLIRRAA